MTDILTKLPHRFISVTGEDTEKFLQGQMSCDLAALDIHQASYGTLNTPKGRMYGLFKIIRTDEGFLFCLQQDTLERVLNILGKYKVFFKCDLQQQTNFHAYGLLAQSQKNCSLPESPLQVIKKDDGITFKLPCSSNMFEIWSSATLEALEKQQDQEAWFAHETLHGLPELYLSTQEKFILQYLNLQEIGAVNFKKGCYTGQEIIARMKFLGKQKKKMFLLKSEAKYCSPPLSDIYNSEGKKCGEVVRSHYSKATGSVALGILGLTLADNNQGVFLDSNLQHKFSINTLHY